MIIESAKESQLDEIMDIWFESTIMGHPFIERDYWEKNFKIVKEEYLHHANTYVCVDNNQLKGFISILSGNHIGALFIKLGEYKKGYGKELISFCKEKYDFLTLSVYVNNKNAVDFYKKQDFVISEIHISDDTGYDEYSMIWNKKTSN